MELSPGEKHVLDRFREKTAIAGGPRSGYVLRRAAIHGERAPLAGSEVDGALDRLVERGFLAPNEANDFFFLTESGVAALSA